MPASGRAISKLGAGSAVVVIAMCVLAAAIIFFPGFLAPHPSPRSAQSAPAGQSFLSSVPSRTASSSSCPGLWPYPPTFNETLVLDNSTLLYPASQTPSISLPAHQSLYLGFSLVNQSGISGSVASSSPIDLSIIANSNGGAVFPMNSNDTTVFSRTNASAVSFILPSPISGDIEPGNYAIIFRNDGGSQANVTVEQGIQMDYRPC
jgi:hypothetical protein